jgi:hypothetical protein
MSHETTIGAEDWCIDWNAYPADFIEPDRKIIRSRWEALLPATDVPIILSWRQKDISSFNLGMTDQDLLLRWAELEISKFITSSHVVSRTPFLTDGLCTNALPTIISSGMAVVHSDQCTHEDVGALDHLINLVDIDGGFSEIYSLMYPTAAELGYPNVFQSSIAAIQKDTVIEYQAAIATIQQWLGSLK